MQHIGIDLGGMESQVCVRAPDGELLFEHKVSTHSLPRFFKRQPRSRVIMETCSEAFTLAEDAAASGHDVRVVPATLVRTLGVGQRGIKTDKRDARVLSEVSTRVDLPGVHVRSRSARNWSSLLKMRQRLVEARTQMINSVRGWLRTQLISVRTTGTTRTFPARVRTKLLDQPIGMPAFVERQLSVVDELNNQIKAADAEVKSHAEEDPRCRRLMTVPGVGPMVASTFVAAVDDVGRFRSAHLLESYLGLTPGERSSSTRLRKTGITKAGPANLRRVLGQAAWYILSRRPTDPLAAWGRQIAERRGRQIAAIAICRKLVGILYAIWRDDTTYDPEKVSRLAAGTWDTSR